MSFCCVSPVNDGQNGYTPPDQQAAALKVLADMRQAFIGQHGTERGWQSAVAREITMRTGRRVPQQTVSKAWADEHAGPTLVQAIAAMRGTTPEVMAAGAAPAHPAVAVDPRDPNQARAAAVALARAWGKRPDAIEFVRSLEASAPTAKRMTVGQWLDMILEHEGGVTIVQVKSAPPSAPRELEPAPRAKRR